MRVAFLDLDHTLLVCDSNQLWMNFLLSQQMISLEQFNLHEKFMDDYANGTLNFTKLQSFRVELDASLPFEKMRQGKSVFENEILLPAIAPLAANLMYELRHQGLTTVVVSATRSDLINPVAQQLRVDHVISSCFGQDKVNQVEAWLSTFEKSLSELDESWFYSDSHNDMPLLDAVTYPVAVDPDHKLEQIANNRKWKQISLRTSICS